MESPLKSLPARLTIASTASYHIELSGGLDKSWSDYLGDMSIEVTQDAAGHVITILTGSVIDQAMLMGVLNTVYNMGLSLLLVRCINESIVAHD
jgi:hypothetical protein